MTSNTSSYPRGSEWRQWDLHIHSPASFHWMGEKFSPQRDQPRDIELVDEMIIALNDAKPAVFGLQDYWCFDGWFALKRRIATLGAPKLEKTLFPGIELRIAAPMKGRLNAHVLFSDQIADQHLHDFLSTLRLELTDRPISRDALVDYARNAADAAKLRKHGFDKKKVDANDDLALEAGCAVAELKVDSYKKAIAEAPTGMAVGFMPFDTNDGLSSIDCIAHYAYALSLVQSSPIFEARDEATWNAFVGRKTDKNAAWFDAFQSALQEIPRLPVSGSDAHQFSGTAGDNDKRGYGDYPSGRVTWIKADPTWCGLLHAIKEPAKRCYIGAQPPKLKQIAEHGSFYVHSVHLGKTSGSTLSERWFDGTELPLNPDLVAIIGNKGSGKSALADVLALLGNSKERKFFSFLRRDRFRGKSGEPARQFEGALLWHSGEACVANLAEDPSPERVELIRYIPQGRFEALCNEHVSGRSDGFESELRTVIFSHIADENRLGALNFDQLTEEQEKGFRGQLAEMRKHLGLMNRSIANIEEQLHPSIRQNIEEKIRLKDVQIKSLEEAKPVESPQPTETLAPEQQAAMTKLAEITWLEDELAAKELSARERQAHIAAMRGAGQEATDRIKLFNTQVASFRSDLAAPFGKLGLNLDDVISISIKMEKLEEIMFHVQEYSVSLVAEIQANSAKRNELVAERNAATDALNGPQRLYQTFLAALAEWQQNIDDVIGSESSPDSKKGLEKRLEQILTLPSELDKRRAERTAMTASIFDVLSDQRDARTMLFSPLQELIARNTLIREEYRLQFRASLAAFHDTVSENLFLIVKQNSGDLRGDDESRQQIKQRMDAHELDKKSGALSFVDSVHELLHAAARQSSKIGTDLTSLMRKDRLPAEVYDYLFGLQYLEPKYTLLFQNTQIEQLSPGQRGALLLIFYLLVDKGRNPIILDQPEENLDNETIVSLLVPVIDAAKEQRQIIMVTHNPNLAVVCDAEQIIFAEFDRQAGPTITYHPGSIEDGKLNGCVVNVLEGTKRAFDNRRQKYH